MKVNYKNKVVAIANILLNDYAFDHKYTYHYGLIYPLEKIDFVIENRESTSVVVFLEAKRYAIRMWFDFDEGTFRITRCKIEEGSCSIDDVGETEILPLHIKRFRKALDEEISKLKEAYEIK